MSFSLFTSNVYILFESLVYMYPLISYYNPINTENKNKDWDLILITSFIVVTFINPDTIKKKLYTKKKKTITKKETPFRI